MQRASRSQSPTHPADTGAEGPAKFPKGKAKRLTRAVTDTGGGPPPPEPLKGTAAVVLGATSLVGRFLVDRLVEAGVNTTAVSRRPQATRPGVSWITTDLTALELPAATSRSVAFSALPIWLLPAALPALQRIGVLRLVAFSSTSRYTKVGSPIDSEREVVRRLIEGETQLEAFCEKNEIAWTILRPTVIYAEGLDLSITRLANLIRKLHILPLAGDALGKRQPVHADDLAAGALAAATSPATRNRSYDVPGGEILSFRSMSERIFEGMGRRPMIVSVPPPIWRLGLSLASVWMPGMTTEMGSRMADDLVFDPTPAERDFSWRPRGFRPHFPDRGRQPP
jgi:nucleoside-diphosphate-sugar epimerase